MRSAGGQEASCRRSTRDQQAADGGTAESQQATGPPGAHGLEGRLSGLPLPRTKDSVVAVGQTLGHSLERAKRESDLRTRRAVGKGTREAQDQDPKPQSHF